MEMSFLQKVRLQYKPLLPPILYTLSAVSLKPISQSKHLDPRIRSLFPHTQAQTAFEIVRSPSSKAAPLRIGVVFSGGQAAGGHNVIAALYDALLQIHPSSALIGFLDGPSGIIKNQSMPLTAEAIAPYRNQGGFDLIGSGRAKIETPQQFQASLQTVLAHDLDGLVIVGGDDSNTNGALLAEYFLAHGCKTCVVGVPKTIDGDLRSSDIEISFGFDSACKTYAETIGNIAKDAASGKKYYHFIRLMGRSASHIALECALQTQPNLTLIGEEGKSLSTLVDEIADLIRRRSEIGKEYGVILIPEGLIEFIPEIKFLIQELNQSLATGEPLSIGARASLSIFPENIQRQLGMERDSHGNVQVSWIETEQMLIELVRLKLDGWKGKFNTLRHFLGYEGRSCLPTNFDANYCSTLGTLAALCVRDGATGVIASVQNLAQSVSKWQLKAVPIVDLLHFEQRSGREKPVIEKALVDLKSSSYVHYKKKCHAWELEDHYLVPGPIQFFGPAELTDAVPVTLR